MGTDSSRKGEPGPEVTLFLCGDVMLGRGIDQVFPHSADPRLYEPVVDSATRYVALAEAAHGPIPRPVEHSWVWGRALPELERAAPDVRIVNLETAITTSDVPWPGKGIHYRMDPANVPALEAAKIDCAVLSNNHTLDWGVEGLRETLRALDDSGILAAGAGRDRREARAPAVLGHGSGGRVLVFGVGAPSSGIPLAWKADAGRPGVRLLDDLDEARLEELTVQIREAREEGDIVLVSIHWGGNWGFRIPPGHREFARGLIDEAGVDVVHGHSSHHPLGIEVHHGHPILYGCGDFLNDYEGIEGREEFRSDRGIMYLPTLDVTTGTLQRFEIIPLVIRRFRLETAPPGEVEALGRMFDREGKSLGTGVERMPDGRLMLRWS